MTKTTDTIQVTASALARGRGLKLITVKPKKERLGDHSTPGDLIEAFECIEFKESTKAKNRGKPEFANVLRNPAATLGKALAYVGKSPIVTRAQAGLRAPKGAYTRIRPTFGSTLHWEGPSMGSFAHTQCASKVRAIQAFHMNTRGWDDIAYNAVVCPHGYIFQGRWMWNRSAANGTNVGNDTSYAICFLGGEGDPLTGEAKRAFKDCIALFDLDGGAGSGHKAHHEWKSTACAGPEINAWESAGLPLGGWTPSPAPAPVPPQSLTYQVQNAVGFIEDPTSDGGWMLDVNGGIYTLSPSGFFGSLGGVALNAPITGGVCTPSGQGYLLVGADGGVFTFGDAIFRGTHAPLGDEYRAGQRKIIGIAHTGRPEDRSTWGYMLISNRLEAYAFAA